ADDGNNALWVASDMGLERFRGARIRLEPAITPRDPGGYMATSGLGGTVRIVDTDRVYGIAPGKVPVPVLPDGKQYSNLCAAADGGYWLLIGETLLRHIGGRGDYSIATPPGTTTYLCAEDDQGRLWLNNFSRDNYWHDAGGWHLMRGPAALEELIRLPSGKVVGQFGTDYLMLLDGPLPRPIPAADIGVGNIVTVSPGLTDTFVSGSAGFARWRDNRFQSLRGDRYPWLVQVNGLVQTRHGDTWLFSSRGIARVASRDLDRAFDSPGTVLAYDLFDQRDGLTGVPQHFGMAGPQVVRGGDDRVWFLTSEGIMQLAPGALARDPAPPNVSVSSVTAGGQRILDPTAVTLPRGTTRLAFEFTALGLTDPERASFRYRLEGLEGEWLDAGDRRQASYTNLAPGRYRFRVIAANRNGLWNRSGAFVDITIPPTFIQTPIFRILIALMVLLLLWLLYRLRLRQVARGIGQRLEARLSERERIARELHDTLLQGIQGLVMRFQSAARRIEPESPARAELETALDRADDVLAQGRDKVLQLRAGGMPVDARIMLAQLIARQPFTEATKVTLQVDGQLAPLQPIIADEVAAIVGEALFNAARHADASLVEVLAKAGLDGLALVVRDNGVGMSNGSLTSEPKHFGLIGMRERTSRIGADLTIGPGTENGTEVVLIVPARIAFQAVSPSDNGTWLDRIADTAGRRLRRS
ncbi:MAG: ATP-binding protein, partial [Janthinobacterium lividum]